MGNFSIYKNVNGKYAATDVRHYDPMLILGEISMKVESVSMM